MVARIIRKLSSLVALGLAAVALCAHATSLVPTPRSLADYLDTADLIVVGRIGQVHKIHTFFGYDWIGPTPPAYLGIPMVDYAVIVTEVIRDDVRHPVSTRSPLLLRVIQDHSTISAPETLAQNAGEFLLFLTRNPDGATYGFWSFEHKVRLDDNAPEHLYG